MRTDGCVDEDENRWAPSDEELDELLAAQPAGDATEADQATAKTAEETAQMAALFIPGDQFLLEESADVVSVWGEGEQSLWAEGEGLMICGGQGVGKTTLGQQLALARVGLWDSLLGFPVAPSQKRVLYLAADRPRQARRSMARMVTAADRAVLNERLTVWKGPLPADVAYDPGVVLRMCEAAGADTVIIDSLKDVAVKLSEDGTGSLVNRAFQFVVAAGIELLVLHHQRKAGSGLSNSEPNSISDVYGSTWLTSGLGSVIYLGGNPGDLVVKLKHLKQPSEVVGPLEVLHDHRAGRSTVEDHVDPLEMVRLSRDGLTVHALAAATVGGTPDRNAIEKARRSLNRLVAADLVVAHSVPSPSGGKPTMVFTLPGAEAPRFAPAEPMSRRPGPEDDVF